MKPNQLVKVVTSSLVALTLATASIGAGALIAWPAEAQGNSGNSNAGGNGNGNAGGNGNGNAGGNGGGNANGHGNGNAGGNGNGHGLVARELGGLNAAHASEQAFLNAAANSRVGELAPLREAYGAADEAYRTWQEAFAAYTAERDGWQGRSPEVIQGEIDALDEASETYAEDLERLEGELAAHDAHETRLASLAAASNEAGEAYEEAEGAAEEELAQLAGGLDLSEDALAELRRLLTR
ncbi:hypothetical protein [Nioella sp.]|uniref:hypothetical protein n=1 Tax=Nioella sp. TaxID=1912091 RepID=UPI003515501D